jgi:hypothetical protein
MSMITSARRRQADDLQALLDGARASTPAAAEELAPLVALARSLTPPQHAPREQFRAALRERLVAEAAARPVPTATAAVPRQRDRHEAAPSRVRQAIAAATLAALVGGIGVAAASTRALPGESLYGLKRQVENAQLAIARGDLGRGRELLEQAEARLSEAEALASGETAGDGRTRALIGQSLEDMDAALTEAVLELTEAYRTSGDEEPLLLLDRFVTDQRERLADLMALLDPALRDQARALADQLAAVDQSVSALLGEASRATAASAGVPFGTDDGSGDAGLGLTELGRPGSAAGDLADTGAGAGTLGDLVGSLGGGTGSTDPGTTGSGSGTGSAGGGSVGGVIGSGGTTSSQLPTSVPTLPAPLPTTAPLPTSSPVVSNPLPSLTSTAPLPTVSACVPVPPLTTC